MRVLMWMPAGDLVPGGHRVQLVETAAALRELGVDVTERDGDDPDTDVDLVHGFGLDAEQIHRFRRRRVPVVLSPIYWELDYRHSGPVGGPSVRAALGRARRSARFAVASIRGSSSLTRLAMEQASWEITQAKAYSSADALLPNAAGERDAIKADLKVATEIVVVPNGVDTSRFGPAEGVERDAKAVLYVGRVEPHKNQLGLIQALSGLDVRLSIVGPPHPHHRDYYHRCVAAAGNNVTLHGWVDDQQLPSLYQRSKVHVLPSWFETTGLSSLEGALCGCNIVSTSRGFAAEYFGDDAQYCDPARPETIREAVLEALQLPVPIGLADRIRRSYSWTNVAQSTLDVYARLLARQHPAPVRREARRPANSG